jgi:hypothetical protein
MVMQMKSGWDQKRWYAARRLAGLCTKCVRPSRPGKSVCRVHSEKTREQDRKSFSLRKLAGLCQAKSCDQPVAVGYETYCLEHVQRARDRNRARLRRTKTEVLDHYGNGRCACCGERQQEFLTIDHIHGGGRRHRQTCRIGSIYFWLKKNGYPQGFQVLCMNCNLAKGRFGSCPHAATINRAMFQPFTFCN